MRMVDIIEKKRDGQELTTAEINFFIEGYTKGEIPDSSIAIPVTALNVDPGGYKPAMPLFTSGFDLEFTSSFHCASGILELRRFKLISGLLTKVITFPVLTSRAINTPLFPEKDSVIYF